MKRGFITFNLAMLVFVWVLWPATGFSLDCYSDTEDFDPNQGYIWNAIWSHCIPALPPACTVESAEVEVRAQVWYWGSYPYEQPILVSNSNGFNFSDGYVCKLTPATHPSSSRFYSITCTLKTNQLQWLEDDGCINFEMVTYGGTYYMDYSMIDVCCAETTDCEGDFNGDKKIDEADLLIFSRNFSQVGCADDCDGDLDGDKDIDGYDLSIFMDRFTNGSCL